MRLIKAVLKGVIKWIVGNAKDRMFIFASLYGIFLYQAIGEFAAGTQGGFIYYSVLAVIACHWADKNGGRLLTIDPNAMMLTVNMDAVPPEDCRNYVIRNICTDDNINKISDRKMAMIAAIIGGREVSNES